MLIENISLLAVGLLTGFITRMIWTDKDDDDGDNVIGGGLSFLATLWIGLAVTGFFL